MELPISAEQQKTLSSIETSNTFLADEFAVAIVLNGINYAVMMASPNDLDDFVYGFLLTEQLIESNKDIHEVSMVGDVDSIIVNITLSNRSSARLKESKKRGRGTSGCGLCGTESLDMAMPRLPNMPRVERFEIQSPNQIRSQVNDLQILGAQSGAMHAACWLNGEGEIEVCREDIGRHNALDKVIGVLLKQKPNIESSALLVTSRCGLELVQKAILAKVPNLICLSAPTGLAVKTAAQHNLNIIHIRRDGSVIRFQ